MIDGEHCRVLSREQLQAMINQVGVAMMRNLVVMESEDEEEVNHEPDTCQAMG